jgi:D-lactate dehydrogenase
MSSALDLALADDLRSCLPGPDQVLDGELTRHVQAHDASHFLLLPAAVVTRAGRPRWAGCWSSVAAAGCR